MYWSNISIFSKERLYDLKLKYFMLKMLLPLLLLLLLLQPLTKHKTYPKISQKYPNDKKNPNPKISQQQISTKTDLIGVFCVESEKVKDGWGNVFVVFFGDCAYAVQVWIQAIKSVDFYFWWQCQLSICETIPPSLIWF